MRYSWKDWVDRNGLIRSGCGQDRFDIIILCAVKLINVQRPAPVRMISLNHKGRFNKGLFWRIVRCRFYVALNATPKGIRKCGEK